MKPGYLKSNGRQRVDQQRTVEQFSKIPRHKIERLHTAFLRDFLVFNFDISAYLPPV